MDIAAAVSSPPGAFEKRIKSNAFSRTPCSFTASVHVKVCDGKSNVTSNVDGLQLPWSVTDLVAHVNVDVDLDLEFIRFGSTAVGMRIRIFADRQAASVPVPLALLSVSLTGVLVVGLVGSRVCTQATVRVSMNEGWASTRAKASAKASRETRPTNANGTGASEIFWRRAPIMFGVLYCTLGQQGIYLRSVDKKRSRRDVAVC